METITLESPHSRFATARGGVIAFATVPIDPVGRNATTAADRVDLTIRYMLEHLNQPLKVANLSMMINVSPSHFFALFKRQTGLSPIDFFIRLRMRHARQLLSTTTLSVKEVAAALGYDDAFYFSRLFKAVYAVSPSLYRLQILGKCDRSWTADAEGALAPFVPPQEISQTLAPNPRPF